MIYHLSLQTAGFIAGVFLLLLGLAGMMSAQEMKRFSVTAGAGFTSPVGRTSNIVDTGWNVRFGAGVTREVGMDSLEASSVGIGRQPGAHCLRQAPLAFARIV